MTRKEEIEKASVEYQLENKPMAIGGDAFADMVYKVNVNPSFVAGAEWADEHPIHNENVDLEKAIQQHINDCLDIKFPTTDINAIKSDVEYTARMFFELGQKAMKECIKGIPLQCWQTPCADPNYPCENPQMDCINCPRFGHPQGTITITSMNEKESEQGLVGKETFKTGLWSEIKEEK